MHPSAHPARRPHCARVAHPRYRASRTALRGMDHLSGIGRRPMTRDHARYGARDAATILRRARRDYAYAARLLADGTAVIGDPLAAVVASRREIRAARLALRAHGAPIPERAR